ncbi:MAG: stage II sporulation protein P [Oscillospiraceae bacterium]|nr:stage II sporulation protein P [Oscillospiraceae bacterium]
MEQKAIQLGAVLLTLAFLLRIAGTRGNEEMGRTLLLLSSGRMVTQAAAPEPQPEEIRQDDPTEPAAAIPVFGENQEPLVQVNAPWPVDTANLLRQPLTWDLKAGAPTVLILHSHATESYEKEPGYEETSPYRTLDTNYNMVSVGERVAQLLEAGGIRVIHDGTLHDYPSYNDAYGNARQTVADILDKNPSICLVLDLHRDAAEDVNGRQKVSTATVEGEECANLMLVMGSDNGGLSFPDWERNLALAVKLQAQLEQTYPGLCRPIKVVSGRYNQDLSTGALLIEVGTAGNTHAQALRAAEYLAEGILALANGANY